MLKTPVLPSATKDAQVIQMMADVGFESSSRPKSDAARVAKIKYQSMSFLVAAIGVKHVKHVKHGSSKGGD